MVTIINSGVGNIASILNMIKRVGGEANLASSPDELYSAEKLILPGVGAFDTGMMALRVSGLDDAIRNAVVENGAMILGICLGMQLLLDTSEEGKLPGLGLVPGRVRRLQVQAKGLRVPHMGWSVVKPVCPSTLFETGDEEQRFYFVHSYYVECDDPQDAVGITDYGYDFTSALERGRVLGVQFHPEKSHRFGMALLDRYLKV
jgi:imidazole glycerol-phosphate synthase subunit HisH